MKKLISNKIIILGLLITLALAGIFLMIKDTREKVTLPTVIIKSYTFPDSIQILEGSQKTVIYFQNDVPKNIRSQIVPSYSPDVKTDKIWISPRELHLIPLENLSPDTVYTITLFYKDVLLKELTFKTPRYSEEELRKQGEEQVINDLEFVEAEKNILNEFPWYNKIPIITKDFVIVYDYERRDFRIRLLVAPDSLKLEEVKKEALDRLIKINVDPQKEGYYYLF